MIFSAEVNKAQGIKVLKDGKVVPVEKEEPIGKIHIMVDFLNFIFLKPLFRGNLDPFVNNANLGAIAHTSNGT